MFLAIKAQFKNIEYDVNPIFLQEQKIKSSKIMEEAKEK